LIFWQLPERPPAESSQESIDRIVAGALFNAGACVFPETGTVRRFFSLTVPVSLMNIRK
jgi:hypothetical protein